MRHMGIFLVLFSLLLAGCGGEDGSAAGPTTSSGASDAPTTTAGSELRTVTINASGGEQVPVEVEIADEPAEQTQGLMNRTELAEDRGMLFVFQSETTLSFWMKNTLIPLSVAYMDSGGRIVDIQRMEPVDKDQTIPNTALPRYVSAEPAQYALEVNQGFFEEHGVEVGDTAELPV